MKFLPRRLIIIGVIVLGFAIISATNIGQATTIQEEPKPNRDDVRYLAAVLAEAVNSDNFASLPPPAEQNPCLHCHIAGEIYNEWSPISRWFVFGAMWLTFIFGISRNFMVWRTQDLWHHRWMVYLGRIAGTFLIIQVCSGIILLLIPSTVSGIFIQIEKIIQSIHWVSSIILYVAALGFSLGGAMLPWYQRPFWALIFFTGLIGGALAVANLSFAYFYGEWHDPLPPSHSFILHMLLSPIAIAGIMNIYFMVLRKRGEIQ